MIDIKIVKSVEEKYIKNDGDIFGKFEENSIDYTKLEHFDKCFDVVKNKLNEVFSKVNIDIKEIDLKLKVSDNCYDFTFNEKVKIGLLDVYFDISFCDLNNWKGSCRCFTGWNEMFKGGITIKDDKVSEFLNRFVE